MYRKFIFLRIPFDPVRAALGPFTLFIGALLGEQLPAGQEIIRFQHVSNVFNAVPITPEGHNCSFLTPFPFFPFPYLCSYDYREY
jgi:hypothetical protein